MILNEGWLVVVPVYTVFSANPEETPVRVREPRTLLYLALLNLAGKRMAADVESRTRAIEEVQRGAGEPIIVVVAGEGALKHARKPAREVDPKLVFLRVLGTDPLSFVRTSSTMTGLAAGPS